MYSIDHDLRANMLRLRLTGFWTVAEVHAFADDFLAAVSRITRINPNLVIISDCRDYPVQSTEVTMTYAERLGPAAGMRQPFAVVVGSMLAKLQADRVMEAPNLRAFLSIADAEAWLEDVRPMLSRADNA